MKEKYVGPAYGLGNWRKTDTFTRLCTTSVAGNPGRKSHWVVIWSGAFVTLGALAAGFLWLIGG